MKVERALISVFDKNLLIGFAKGLAYMGIEIIASGGTAKSLKEAGIEVISVEDITGMPSILGGRVKTLHPNIAGGILAKKDKESLEELAKYGIKPIDMVVVNLYPFEETIKKVVSEDEAIEQIDIGGVTLIRAGAKNYRYVACVTNPRRYDEILRVLKDNKKEVPEDILYSLAQEAFSHTARYEAIISGWFSQETFPAHLNLSFKKAISLRYGENPHQRAAFYVHDEPKFKVLQGKANLSYNNILDADSAWGLVSEFTEPCCVIVKHNNPCGVALASDITTSYKSALACDPISAFGGIIALNRPLDVNTAKEIAKLFCEGIVAPRFETEAISLLSGKVRVVVGPSEREGLNIRRALSGILLQEEDRLDYKELKVVTKKEPQDDQMESLIFGLKVAKFTKSNAIILTKGTKTIGIGAGQMSRIDATSIAINKAGIEAEGSTLASDAFFPFQDVVEEAAKAGISAIIQPGGSIRDKEVIETADRLGIAMVFCEMRHFRH
ncbi:MAG: bifunctional phosphoribosylaminoimidazolecarboxamide formyltransferase/IMP cyclohydrolase [bacterium]|nr:bifunctional phosphoribosylaminoimidazolecarboxamide formyltransferase/IMP cyclohydrolase [bacterium]